MRGHVGQLVLGVDDESLDLVVYEAALKHLAKQFTTKKVIHRNTFFFFFRTFVVVVVVAHQLPKAAVLEPVAGDKVGVGDHDPVQMAADQVDRQRAVVVFVVAVAVVNGGIGVMCGHVVV